MVQPTSVSVYNQVQASGLVGKVQLLVYKAIDEAGPISQGEVWREHMANYDRNTVAPRFIELEEMGLIEQAGTRPERTPEAYEAIVYRVTGKLPTKLKRRLSKAERIAHTRNLLNDIIWRVKNNVPINYEDLVEKSNKLIEELETGKESE